MSSRALFKQRQNKNQTEVMHYSKLIFNGHFIIFLTILMGALMLQYSEILKDLPKLPYDIILTALLAALTTPSLRTFIKEADGVFLLSYEDKMTSYMNQAITSSFIKRAIVIIIICLIASPLYFKAINENPIGLIIGAILLIVIAYVSLKLRFILMKQRAHPLVIVITTYIISLISLYSALNNHFVTASVMVLIFGGLVIILHQKSQTLLPWHSLIEYEEDLTQRQYKMINMFTDVRGLKDNVRRRRFLDRVIEVTDRKLNHDTMFLYLFKRNFLRSKDAFWIIIRLVIIGSVFIWLIHQPIVGMLIGLFTVYIIVLQSSQFYKQQAYQLWPQVWPVDERYVISGFKHFLWQLSLVVTTFISIVYIVNYPQTFYYILTFYIMNWWINNQVLLKINKKMNLLKD